MKAFTGKGGQLFNLFEASAMMSTLARLSGRSDDGADGVMTGDLEAIASGTLLPKKVRIHVCGRVAQEGDGLVGEQERMIHVRGVGVEGWDGLEPSLLPFLSFLGPSPLSLSLSVASPSPFFFLSSSAEQTE